MGLDAKQRSIIHETLGTIAGERVRINAELSEHVGKSIKLRETERQLAKCYDQLGELLEEDRRARQAEADRESIS